MYVKRNRPPGSPDIMVILLKVTMLNLYCVFPNKTTQSLYSVLYHIIPCGPYNFISTNNGRKPALNCNISLKIKNSSQKLGSNSRFVN